MAPLITSQPHDKNLISPDDFFSDQPYTELTTLTHKIGPDETLFKFSIFYSNDTGEGVISITTDKTEIASKIVGNVIFKKTSQEVCELNGAISVQISSAVIDDQYRGYALATKAYCGLAEYFHVVSDSMQTVDGAALWKNKITAIPFLNVQVIIGYDTSKPQYLLDTNDQIQLYDAQKAHLEKLIWSSKDQETAKYASSLGIESSVGEHNQSRVLVAKRKSNNSRH